MRSIRTVFFCAGTNFRKWYKNPTILILGLIWFVFNMNFAQGVAEMCLDNGYRISPWLLPFYINNYYTIFMYVIALVILFSQAPFCDTTTPFTMIRTGKLSWCIGQVLYIIGASFVFVAATYGLLLLFIAPGMGYSADWGGVIEGLAEDDSLLREYNSYIGISGSIVREYTAIEATVLTFLLMWLTASLIGSMMLLFNILFRRGIGMVAVGVVAGWTWFASHIGMFTYGFWMAKTTLLNWCSLHSMSPVNSYGVTLSTAVTVELVLMAVCIGISIPVFCKRDTQFEKNLF